MKRIKYVFAVLIVLFCLPNVFPQNNKAKLTDEKKQLERSITQQKNLLATTQKKKNASLREIELIKSQITKQERLIAIINEELNMLDNRIKTVNEELSHLNHKLTALKAEYAQAVYAGYKYRNVFNRSGFILSSQSINQAAIRMNYLQQYSQNLNKQLLAIQKTQNEIKHQSDILQKTKAEKIVLIRDKNHQKGDLDKQRVEKDAMVAQLKKEESSISTSLKRKIDRQKQVNNAINKIIQEEIARSKAAEAAKAKTATASKTTQSTRTTPTPTPTPSTSKTSSSASAKPVLSLTPEQSALGANFESNKGKLPWPVSKGTIINHFGAYSHPEVSSVKITNNGINILTEKGAAVRSVFRGEIAGIIDISGSKSVLIRHGSYITVYSNLATISVKKGDNVETRQVIGTVQTEASETYPELHFEVRKDATPLNPEMWIRQ
jgi:septal ring factor EnvC (AmiA/AmiB activator)